IRFGLPKSTRAKLTQFHWLNNFLACINLSIGWVTDFRFRQSVKGWDMKNFEDKTSQGRVDRRSFLGVTAAAAPGTVLRGLALPANAKSNTQAPKNGRRKLGT